MVMRRRTILTAASLFASLICAQMSAAPLEDPVSDFMRLERTCVPLHVGFFGNVTTVTLKQRGVFYRIGDGPWLKVPIELNGPHSITQLPSGAWLINDTDNHRMVQLDDLAGRSKSTIRSQLGGFPLRRPHDQIVDPNTGQVYLVDGNRRLFRFRDLSGAVDVWTFPEDQLGYIRGLSWFDGHLHLADATRGEVHRIEDFDQRRMTTFRSPTPPAPPGMVLAPHRNLGGGSLSATGLVLNDVEKIDGWYYGTNFFHPFAAFGADPHPGRLIRWRSWDDFERGKWQDLTYLLPESKVPLIPYFITVRDGVLYTGLFDHDEPFIGPTDLDDPCRYDRIVRLVVNDIEPERRLPLEGAANFRDLGGYVAADGKHVRWGTLYRSDALDSLTPNDWQKLEPLDIARITDFRAEREVQRRPDHLSPALEARRVHVPLDYFPKRERQAAGATATEVPLADIDRALIGFYPRFVRENRAEYGAWLKSLLDGSPTSPHVFHCTGGADRTGFAAAVLLMALGVSREQILEDYLLTNQYLYSPEGRALLGKRMASPLPDGVQVHARYLDAAFDAITADYGSFDAYLRDGLGVDDQTRRRLRQKYLE